MLVDMDSLTGPNTGVNMATSSLPTRVVIQVKGISLRCTLNNSMECPSSNMAVSPCINSSSLINLSLANMECNQVPMPPKLNRLPGEPPPLPTGKFIIIIRLLKRRSGIVQRECLN
mmetsp:Transcript_18379/g.32873  ORF Transcript_18379/g.32873 Transcript_18379/m.32873 type:complete len:116 (+) Transcript_18379:321-668(+)